DGATRGAIPGGELPAARAWLLLVVIGLGFSPDRDSYCYRCLPAVVKRLKGKKPGMEIATLHSWEVTPAEGVALQRQLASRIDVRTPLTRCELVAGADVSYNRHSPVMWAGVVVVRVADGAVVEECGAMEEARFPYVPGLLSFREAPPLLKAFRQLQSEPDVILVDGQGLAHPRRFGLACHLGLWLNRPCAGCAKSVLCGQFREPGKRAGSLSPLVDGDEVIGSVVRTRTGVRPVVVSAGHRIDLPSAVRVVLQTCRGYRLPEPIRQAHRHVNELRRQQGAGRR
ncbi:MAG: deoxyribonuclease V, partial [Gemmataceae bacterium]|nr:deoxyribonuclease V [Gemmataceae bacterium]MDW8264174.1 deoxyribonuclease V [Gemmataceae bacterium]